MVASIFCVLKTIAVYFGSSSSKQPEILVILSRKVPLYRQYFKPSFTLI
jgi:hypothetical protein